MSEKGKHLNFSDRKLIESAVAHGMKLIEASVFVGKDPRTIAKELKRNRKFETPPDVTRICPTLKHYPFVCVNCPKRYKRSECLLQRAVYDAQTAQNAYEVRLKQSRKGADLTPNERIFLMNVVSEGLKNKESVYSISKNINVEKSSSTLYRYIHSGYIGLKPSDLPYAMKYKKRKRIDTSYAYGTTNIDRSGRTYPNYLFYKKSNPSEMITQMDFLGNTRKDDSKILVISIPDLEFPILRKIQNPTQEKIKDIFDELEFCLGRTLFKKIFPVVLTDRDPCFADFSKIEAADQNGEVRTMVFYCDPYCSSQKGHVENINKSLRKFFPKGQAITNVNDEILSEINDRICSFKLRSLGGYSAKECFLSLYDEDIYYILINKKNR